MYVRTRCGFIYTAFIPDVILAKDRRMVHHSHPSQPRKCFSMPSTGLSRYPKDACQASYTAAIMAPSTCPSTTRTRLRSTQSPDRLGAWGIPTTTHSPKQLTACTRPSSSPKTHGPASTTSNSPPPNGSTGHHEAPPSNPQPPHPTRNRKPTHPNPRWSIKVKQNPARSSALLFGAASFGHKMTKRPPCSSSVSSGRSQKLPHARTVPQ